MQNFDELILGITCIDNYTHDNSIALLYKNKVLFAASEERYSRIKHDSSFPEKAIDGALSYLKLKPALIKTIAVGYPKRKILSVLYNRYFYEIIPFLVSILIYRNFRILGDLVTFTKLLYQKLRHDKERRILKNKRIIYIDHHLSHAASAYYTSGFNKCVSIVLDAFGAQSSGRIRSGAIFLCDGGRMQEVMTVPIYSSLGLFYMAITYGLGFKPGDGEGKVMGLAAYGDPNTTYRKIRPYAPTFKNGEWSVACDWLAGIIPSIPKIEYLFKATKFGKTLDSLIKECEKKDVAAGAQKILEEEFVKLAEYILKTYPEYNNICLSGGVFLNVKGNKKIMEVPNIKEVFVHPNASDGGVALGAAFMATPMIYKKRFIRQPLVSCGLGESFKDLQILKTLKSYNNRISFKRRSNIIDYTSDRLMKGKVIGWFVGGAEWGPRALGFRSVLADPRNIVVKDRINKILKNREWFMPFAPSILEEEGAEFFINFRSSPFMTFTFDTFPKKEKLFPAALHIDKTARPNTVNIQNNPLYYKLLKAFYRKTGLPILLNTSFNRHGLPIVNSPKDAIDHLLMGAVDELIIGNYSVNRNS